MRIKKLQAIFIMTALLFGVSSASGADYKTRLILSITSAGSDYDEAYTLTVPTVVEITKSGWNELGSLAVKYSGEKDGFDPSKKLVITATSTNSFLLRATGVGGGISYYLATGENDTRATTTFEFTADEITATGTSKTIGVNVEEYKTKPAGDYEDEITYNVEVQNLPITVTWNNDDITGSGNSFTKNGVTITTSYIDFDEKFFADGTFTTTLGNFTKIEVTSNSFPDFNGTGWTVSGNTAIWTGNASSVSFDGAIWGKEQDVTFVFMIDPQSESESGSDNMATT